jgi:hypothetical protein
VRATFYDHPLLFNFTKKYLARSTNSGASHYVLSLYIYIYIYISCPLGLSTRLSTLFSNTFNNISTLMVTDHVSHPQNLKQRVKL